MSERTVEVGDVCYLKSGSQRLTVTAVYSGGDMADKVQVMWMHFETQMMREAILPVAALDVPNVKPSKVKPAYSARDDESESESYKGDSNNG